MYLMHLGSLGESWGIPRSPSKTLGLPLLATEVRAVQGLLLLGRLRPDLRMLVAAQERMRTELHMRQGQNSVQGILIHRGTVGDLVKGYQALCSEF